MTRERTERNNTRTRLMQMGMIGLGRMGGNMVRRLMRGGHQIVVSDLSADTANAIAEEGAVPSSSLDVLVRKPNKRRAVWVMVPEGDPTEKTVMTLAERLEAGDTIIDDGNSMW